MGQSGSSALPENEGGAPAPPSSAANLPFVIGKWYERMNYWDTSTLGKLYFPEADSPAFAQKAASATVIVIAKLAPHEMSRVAFRKECEGLIPANTAEAVLNQVGRDIVAGQIQVVEMGTQTEAEFNAIMAR